MRHICSETHIVRERRSVANRTNTLLHTQCEIDAATHTVGSVHAPAVGDVVN